MNTASDQELVGLFYEAALCPDKWTDALEGLRNVAGSEGAALTYGRSLEGQVAVAIGLSDDCARDYGLHFHALDPLISYGLRQAQGSWLNDWRVAGASFRHTEYYNDFYGRHGLHACTSAVLELSDDHWACASFHRSKGKEAFQAADEERLGALMGDLSRAVRLQRETEMLRRRAELAEAALDASGVAVWLLDPKGKVLLANAAAQRLCQSADLVSEAKGQLILRRRDPSVLSRAIADATRPAAAAASWVKLALDADTPAGARVATIAPLPERVRGRNAQGPIAVVLIKEQSSDVQVQDILKVLYRLSPREAQTAALVASGLQPKEVAALLGLATESIRALLKAIFLKTGVGRQADLVRLVSELSQARCGSTGAHD